MEELKSESLIYNKKLQDQELVKMESTVCLICNNNISNNGKICSTCESHFITNMLPMESQIQSTTDKTESAEVDGEKEMTLKSETGSLQYNVSSYITQSFQFVQTTLSSWLNVSQPVAPPEVIYYSKLINLT